MADRPYWQEMREYIYDSVNDELNTQEEIDTKIADALSIYDHFTFDQDEIEDEFKSRVRTFWDPVDLIRWAEEAGIPESAIQIWGEEHEDDIEYHIYVSDNS